jgi:uncharacterized protein (TIGR02996 family)
MDHERAFHEAITEQPDDDLHRLAWADWLDDHGQHARAAFVRAQLRLATLADDDLARDPLEDEADDLLAAHDAEWVGRLAQLALEWQWRRGCIEQVTVRADTLIEHGKELFALAPIREVRLLGGAESFAPLAACEVLQRVEALDLGVSARGWLHLRADELRERHLTALLTSPHLKRLTSLNLSEQPIEGPLLQALIDARAFQRLAHLSLRSCRAVGDRAVRLLAAVPAEHLESLDLLYTNVTGAGVRAMLGGRRFPRLHDVRFRFSLLFPRVGTTDALERELHWAPLLARLETVHLEHEMSPHCLDFLVALLRRLPAGQVRRLYLSNHKLTVEQVETLVGCASLGGLRDVELPQAGLRDSGAKALASAATLSHVTRLHLGGNPIGGPGIRALLESPTLARVRELTLWSTYVGTPGAGIIAGTDRPRLLTFLSLAGTHLDPESARLLAGSPNLSRLRYLSLSSNQVGDEGARALAASPHLRRLRGLNLNGNDIVSPDTERVLRQRFGRALYE